MRWWMVLGLWLLATYSATAWATNPGFAARITNKGLDYAQKLGIQALQKELSKIKVPDLHGSKRIRFLGRVSYDGYRINVRSFHLPTSAITLVPGVGLRISISNAYIHLNGRWRVRARFVRDRGSFDVKIQGVSISLVLKLGSDRTERPTVSPSDCRSSISNVNLKIRGRFRFLYRLFRKHINKAVRKAMEKQICPVVVNTINRRLPPILHTLPVNTKIDRFAAIDYSLVGPPLATAEALDVHFKGQFLDVTGNTKISIAPPPLQFPVDHSHMLSFGVSEYFFNTAGIIYKGAGALVFDLTDKMIPKNYKIRLSTSSIGIIIPKVQKMYPNRPVMMRVAADTAPFVTISPGKFTVTATCNIETSAILPNKSLARLFVLHVGTTISAKIGVRNKKLVGSLSLDSIRLNLKHSDVGFFHVKSIEETVRFFITYVIVPYVNGILANGFPLPVLDNIRLNDVVVEPKQHYLLLAVTVVYGA
ncbi:bactericidal permeability-increasing protein-like [Protopterus annectens]|uniref:bactericidal permeability-increasing protein-like n=1 Tax=Protopterus annectens TaxID=7888 RepID=UPI001CF955B0|nr:bactericidal permeability-increasing protein-like [Protopterus annectens]